MLFTSRLVLLPLNRDMLEQRITQDTFELMCHTPDGPLSVHFPAQWPGDSLPWFPAMLANLPVGQDEPDSDGSFAVITRENPTAVGQIGSIGQPDEAGALEIGYGINPSSWGQGYATEAVGAMVNHLLTCPGVKTIIAYTAVSNRASERVLEKLGFGRTGTSWNEDDGDLTVWRYPSA